nr:MAG TPA: hypothetical protein [Caudoviricetes sp.]
MKPFFSISVTVLRVNSRTYSLPSKVNFNCFAMMIYPPYFFLLCVHADRRGRSDSDSHFDNLVRAAAVSINRQKTFKLKLTAVTSRSDDIASFRTTEPNGELLLRTFQCFQLLVFLESVVRSELKRIEGLNTRNVSLHFVRQSSSFQHFRRTAEVGKLLNVNQLLPCGSILLHEKNLVSVNSHGCLPPINSFVFRDDSPVSSHHSVNCCVFLVGNRVHKGSCESECFHLGINESDDCFTFSFLAAHFVRVDIHLVKHLYVVFDTPGISSVTINLIVCLNEKNTRKGRWRLDIFASHIDFRVFLSYLCGHDIEYLCLNVNHPNTSFAID